MTRYCLMSGLQKPGCDCFSCGQLPQNKVKSLIQCVAVQEVGVHVMAPANVLTEDPLPHAVAVQPLREVATARQNGGHSLPPGAGRFAVIIDGTETEEEVASLKNSDAVMALLEMAPDVSRVHASRRIFELLQRHEIDISVVHFRRYTQQLPRQTVAKPLNFVCGSDASVACSGHAFRAGLRVSVLTHDHFLLQFPRGNFRRRHHHEHWQ